jgi:4a-hydroxytetrahydrobiopterin dehydratase
MEEYLQKKCLPCEKGTPPLKGEALKEHAAQLGSTWDVIDEHHLMRLFTFPDFAKALEYVNRVGALAEEEGHHPDIYLGWGKVELTLWTHKIDGLSESDFIMAAKCSALYEM